MPSLPIAGLPAQRRFSTVALAPGSPSSDRAASFLEQARAAVREKRWLEAEAAYLSALQVDPRNAIAMRELADVFRRTGRKGEATQLERAATAIAGRPKTQAARTQALIGWAELAATLLNPASLGLLLFASMLLPILPWIAFVYYRVTPGGPASRRTLIAWIFQGVRVGRVSPFGLGLAFGAIWIAILGPFAVADSDPGLRVFAGTITFFTLLCAGRIAAGIVWRRQRAAS